MVVTGTCDVRRTALVTAYAWWMVLACVMRGGWVTAAVCLLALITAATRMAPASCSRLASATSATVVSCSRTVWWFSDNGIVYTNRAFLPARYYASVGTIYSPLSVCLCLSLIGVLSKRLNESGWFLALELLSTYPALRYKEIQVPSKITVLPSGPVLQALDLENFATAYRSLKCVIDLARERWTLQAW